MGYNTVDTLAVTGSETPYTFTGSPTFVTITNLSTTATVYIGFGIETGKIAVGKGLAIFPQGTLVYKEPKGPLGNMKAISSSGTANLSIFYGA